MTLPAFVVAGGACSGTTMMMRMLGAGGCDVVYSTDRDEHLCRTQIARPGYEVNPDGAFYEPAGGLLTDPLRMADELPGRCVKIVHPRADCSVPMVNELRFRMLVMLRDPRASETSMRHAFLHGRSVQPEQYWTAMFRAVAGLQERPDVEDVLAFWYPAVVADPMFHVKLLERHGWPIVDTEAAAAVPDPAWHRHRMPWEM